MKVATQDQRPSFPIASWRSHGAVINFGMPNSRQSMRCLWIGLTLISVSVHAQDSQLPQVTVRVERRAGVSRANTAEYSHAVLSNVDVFRRCVANALRRGTVISGELVLDASIGSGGTRVDMLRGSDVDSTLRMCLTLALTRMAITPTSLPTGGRVHLTIPPVTLADPTARAAAVEVRMRDEMAVIDVTRDHIQIEIHALDAATARAYFARVEHFLPQLSNCRRRATRDGHSPVSTFRAMLSSRPTGLVLTDQQYETWDRAFGTYCFNTAMSGPFLDPQLAVAVPGHATLIVRYLP